MQYIFIIQTTHIDFCDTFSLSQVGYKRRNKRTENLVVTSIRSKTASMYIIFSFKMPKSINQILTCPTNGVSKIDPNMGAFEKSGNMRSGANIIETRKNIVR